MRLLKILFFMLSFASFTVYAEQIMQVNINTANVLQLKEVLYGVGEKKAQAIVDYRNEHGAFNSAQDLMLVHGIGKKTVEKNLDKIILAEPVSEPAPDEATPVEEQPDNAANPPVEQVTEAVSESVAQQTPDVEPDFSDAQIAPESLEAAKTEIKSEAKE